MLFIGLGHAIVVTVKSMASTAALDELRRIQERINTNVSEVGTLLEGFPGKGMDVQGITQPMKCNGLSYAK